MSKTFKNAHTVHGKMTVREDGGCVSVSVNMDSPSDTIIHLAPSDAPALMQAIAECLPPIPDIVRDGSYEAYMAVVVTYLDKAVRALESEAELEAEALELFNANQGTELDDWKYADRSVVSSWVRVARKAHEMRK